MGYDMVLVNDPTDHAALNQALLDVKRAKALLDELPSEERGEINIARMRELGCSYADSRAWDGRSKEYARRSEILYAAHNRVDRERKNYFRLNVYGMMECRRLMSEFGMVQATAEPRPSWPAPDDFGITDSSELDEMRARFYNGKDAYVPDNYRSYFAAQDAVRSWTPSGVLLGIQLEKLCSNDGWLVTPEECRAAVKAYEQNYKPDAGLSRTLSDEEAGWWPSWIEWLRLAADNGGFRVH